MANVFFDDDTDDFLQQLDQFEAEAVQGKQLTNLVAAPISTALNTGPLQPLPGNTAPIQTVTTVASQPPVPTSAVAAPPLHSSTVPAAASRLPPFQDAFRAHAPFPSDHRAPPAGSRYGAPRGAAPHQSHQAATASNGIHAYQLAELEKRLAGLQQELQHKEQELQEQQRNSSDQTSRLKSAQAAYNELLVKLQQADEVAKQTAGEVEEAKQRQKQLVEQQQAREEQLQRQLQQQQQQLQELQQRLAVQQAGAQPPSTAPAQAAGRAVPGAGVVSPSAGTQTQAGTQGGREADMADTSSAPSLWPTPYWPLLQGGMASNVALDAAVLPRLVECAGEALFVVMGIPQLDSQHGTLQPNTMTLQQMLHHLQTMGQMVAASNTATALAQQVRRQLLLLAHYQLRHSLALLHTLHSFVLQAVQQAALSQADQALAGNTQQGLPEGPVAGTSSLGLGPFAQGVEDTLLAAVLEVTGAVFQADRRARQQLWNQASGVRDAPYEQGLPQVHDAHCMSTGFADWPGWASRVTFGDGLATALYSQRWASADGWATAREVTQRTTQQRQHAASGQQEHLMQDAASSSGSEACSETSPSHWPSTLVTVLSTLEKHRWQRSRAQALHLLVLLLQSCDWEQRHAVFRAVLCSDVLLQLLDPCSPLCHPALLALHALLQGGPPGPETLWTATADATTAQVDAGGPSAACMDVVDNTAGQDAQLPRWLERLMRCLEWHTIPGTAVQRASVTRAAMRCVALLLHSHLFSCLGAAMQRRNEPSVHLAQQLVLLADNCSQDPLAGVLLGVRPYLYPTVSDLHDRSSSSKPLANTPPGRPEATAAHPHQGGSRTHQRPSKQTSQQKHETAGAGGELGRALEEQQHAWGLGVCVAEEALILLRALMTLPTASTAINGLVRTRGVVRKTLAVLLRLGQWHELQMCCLPLHSTQLPQLAAWVVNIDSAAGRAMLPRDRAAVLHADLELVSKLAKSIQLRFESIVSGITRHA